MSGDNKIIADLKSENEKLRQRLGELESQQLNIRQIEATLHERELTFRNLTETIPASIHVLQGNQFCYINSGFSEMTGYRLAECLKMNFWDLVHPDYQNVIRDRAWARQRGEEVVPVHELKIISKSGRELWVDHTATNTIWDGKPAIIAVLHDLTERQRIEEQNRQQHILLQETYSELEEIYAELQSSQSSLLEINSRLHESEERYRTLVETIPEIVAHSDLLGNCIWINTPGIVFFGKDVYQHNFQDYFICDEHYQQAIQIITPALQSNEIAQLETLLERQDGQIRMLKWQCKTLAENGEFKGIVSTARDITEKREAELRLQQSEARYRHLFEKSPVGLLKVDKTGAILDANEYYVKMNGAPSKEAVININIFNEATSRADVASIIDKIIKQYQKSQIFFTEMDYVSKWGVPLCIQYKIDPLFDQDNQFQHIIIACEEISERKEAEARIKYLIYNDSLTGLYNRAFFDEELLRLDIPTQLPLSIIIGDVNGLKLVNDTFGHLTGDKLLQNIAQILKDCCRPADIVTRWGGDEFAILLPQTSSKTAYDICDRIRIACKEGPHDPIRPSIALGVASKENFDEDISKVITEAEDIMYRNKLLESKSIRNAIISSLETSLHEKTMETREHAQRMQNMCMQFGRALDLPANEIDRLALLARLHDIGKIGVADEILNKAGELSAEEWLEIKKHPEIGYRIVYSSHELVAIAEEILCHHERWDGKGYPEGLRAKDIPLLARVVAIVDAYDVMTHARSYKEAIPHDQAVAEIIRCSATQFDPELVRVFLNLFE